LFPTTRRSALSAMRSADPAERARGFETLVAAYWRPVYKYIRIKWSKSSEDAQDLTQGFFVRAMEKQFFRGYDPARAAFRTFLRTCLDGFVANEHQADQRLKRGGGVEVLSLDFEGAEGELQQHPAPDGMTPEECFHREWLRSVFGLAVDTLRRECEAEGKGVHFRLFERYDLEEAGGLTYEALAAELGQPATAVTNYLAATRRRFRRIVLELMGEVDSP